MSLRCKLLGHRWSGPALTSTLDGHMTRRCSRGHTVLIYLGYRARYEHYA